MEKALAAWRELTSDEGAVYDKDVLIEADAITPQVTWGTSPQDVLPITASVPDPRAEKDEHKRKSMERALEYMALQRAQDLRMYLSIKCS